MSRREMANRGQTLSDEKVCVLIFCVARQSLISNNKNRNTRCLLTCCLQSASVSLCLLNRHCRLDNSNKPASVPLDTISQVR